MVALVLLPVLAHAGVSLQATVTASAGVTDNIASEPTNPCAGQPASTPCTIIGRQSDFLAVISPGLILSGGTARAVQTLYYTFGGVIYGHHSEADTYTNTVGWRGLFLPSKTTRVGTLLSVLQGRSSAFNTAIPSAGEPAQTQLSGSPNVLTAVGVETFAWDISALWLLTQSAGYSTSYFLTQPIQGSTRAVPLTLAVERRFKHSAMGLSVNGTYTQFFAQRGALTLPGGAVEQGGIVEPQSNQIIMTPTVTYRRDLTYWLSARAGVGAAIVFDPTNVASHYFGPAGTAGINFNTTRAVFDLAYSHLVVPNLLFAANFVSDTVAARGTFILSHKYDVGLSMGISYLYAQEVDLKVPNSMAVVCTNTTGASTGGIGSSSSCDGHGYSHSVLGDITLGWNARPELQFFLRYQLIDQIGHESAAFPIATYYRNTVLFGLTATYPAEPAVRVGGNSMGVRADHSDDAHIETSNSTQPQQN